MPKAEKDFNLIICNFIIHNSTSTLQSQRRQYKHIISLMKRSAVLYGILIVIAIGVIIAGFVLSQDTLDNYELLFLVIILPIMGWLWLQAYVDATKGN